MNSDTVPDNTIMPGWYALAVLVQLLVASTQSQVCLYRAYFHAKKTELNESDCHDGTVEIQGQQKKF